MTTPRQLVYDTLDFASPERVPRQLWTLPWASIHHPEALSKIRDDFPNDITGSPGFIEVLPKTYGDPYEIGEYIDEWGCRFLNKDRGIIGEVKEPIVVEEDWEDVGNVHIPVELLKIDRKKVNEFCNAADTFVTCGACPRPFEQLQFMRGTEQLYIDLMLRPPGMMKFLKRMHQYYCDLLQVWAETEVDALNMMDDWGAQHALLINPTIWREVFKPMYKDYVDIAHSHNKKMFMHSDGHILAVYPDLIEIGVDAMNSQIFCMGIENLKPFGGQITFWGEIDRQHLLPNGTTEEITDAVRSVKEALWKDGGCIAQCEFGAGAKPENVRRVYEAWNSLM